MYEVTKKLYTSKGTALLHRAGAGIEPWTQGSRAQGALVCVHFPSF